MGREQNDLGARGGLGLHPALLAFLQSMQAPRPPAAVLELGCGDGGNALALGERGYRVTAIDLSELVFGESQRVAAERQLPVQFREMNILRVDTFQPSSFDVVIAVACLWMLRDEQWPRLLEGARRVLSPGGVFLVSDTPLIQRLRPDQYGFETVAGQGYVVLRPVQDRFT